MRFNVIGSFRRPGMLLVSPERPQQKGQSPMYAKRRRRQSVPTDGFMPATSLMRNQPPDYRTFLRELVSGGDFVPLKRRYARALGLASAALVLQIANVAQA